MVPEILALFGFVLILAGVGLGPSAWLFAQRAYPGWAGLAAAPTIGFAIVGLLSFPLYRYLAPVRVWAWPVTAFLLVISMLQFVHTRRKLASACSISWRACALTVGLVALLLGARATPLYFAGIHQTVFASNPADAFTVMTLAESARMVTWKTLSEGSDLADAEGVRKLAQESPTALFSARFLKHPIRMTSMVALAYGAELFGIETYRFYYPFKLASLAIAVPVFLLWGWKLGLPRGWSVGLASAFFLGFWAQINLELDSTSQINAMPLCLLLVLGITGLLASDEDAPTIRRSQFLIALLCAALCCYYPEYLFLCACAGAVSMMTLLASGKFAAFVCRFSMAALGAIGLLLLSGQLVYLVKYQLFIAKWTASAGGGSSHPLMPLFADDFAATLFGIYPIAKALSLTHALWVLGLVLPVVLAWLILSIAHYATHALRTPFHDGKVLVACVGGGLLMYNVFVIASGEYTAAKALLFTAPFLPLAIAVSLIEAPRGGAIGLPNSAIARLLLAFWILSQLAIGTFAISRECGNQTLLGWTAPVVSPKAQDYDLGSIGRFLKKNPPINLLVNVPPSKNWTFPIFCIFALNKYKPFFQSGLIYDNRKDSPRYFFQTLESIPDYAIVERGSDYIEEFGLGERVASAGKLRLYRITSTDLGAFTKFNAPASGFVAP